MQSESYFSWFPFDFSSRIPWPSGREKYWRRRRLECVLSKISIIYWPLMLCVTRMFVSLAYVPCVAISVLFGSGHGPEAVCLDMRSHCLFDHLVLSLCCSCDSIDCRIYVSHFTLTLLSTAHFHV